MAKKKPAKSTRDSRGRFVAGHGGGPGRPPKERERDFARAFDLALPAHELTAAVEAVVAKAKEGSVAALRLLLEYSIGRPKQRVEIETKDEYRVAGQSPAEGMRDMVDYINKRVSERTAYEKRVKKLNGDAG